MRCVHHLVGWQNGDEKSVATISKYVVCSYFFVGRFDEFFFWGCSSSLLIFILFSAQYNSFLPATRPLFLAISI